MFGFQGGESAETISRKRGYRKDAQQRWGFLTSFDLSLIRNEVGLCSMVKERLGVPEAQARSEVRSWMQGKQF